ncbi:MAG: TIGR03016 family PEP-CTERM system-associated outer membrane protein [Propionivibrio sp.]|uniref:TIGR03016 family PEP-CTERM system-associated outer membrane protein n=1 Tax=Propionivibrio sp. TaxID=2212460 RepID=UPI001B76534E|nr:TIGR03016 family PEP-CTERM system-associated outer membrane protein [Propionivibrio sp.]MBP7203331.1 TIGR03016 family PEP-CTERM system-associated outer membrane protein [Propionivibrio sp.]
MGTAMDMAMGTVMAMRTEPGRHKVVVRRLGKVLLAAGLASAMTPACAGSWTITPTVAVTETATDNVARSDRNRQSDLISDVNPGIRIEGSGGRAKLRFDYQMHNLFYAQDSSRNETQNSLNALGTLEAIEDWLFIEASGYISQQNLSAFDSSSSSSSVNVNTLNTTETSTYRISPYIVGSFGSFADYQLRYNLATTSRKSNLSNDENVSELVGSLKGTTSLASLGWSIDASTQDISYDRGRDNEADRLRGVLTYQINPQFRANLIGGVEANNYQSLDKESTTTYGAGFDWSPTDRTLLSVSREHRFFGQANAISFSHRTASTAWKFSDTEDVVTQTGQRSTVGLGTYYDLLAMNFPGISRKDAEALLGGIDLNAQIPGDFLTNESTIQHRRELSFALLGARNTVTFSAGETQSERASQGALSSILGTSDFANAQKIRQRVASINWSHKLTPLSSLIATVSRSNSKGSGTSSSSLETTEQMYHLNLTTQLGPKTHANLGFRRAVGDGTVDYTENALTGTLSHQF